MGVYSSLLGNSEDANGLARWLSSGWLSMVNIYRYGQDFAYSGFHLTHLWLVITM
jgi:hypothetical protein